MLKNSEIDCFEKVNGGEGLFIFLLNKLSWVLISNQINYSFFSPLSFSLPF